MDFKLFVAVFCLASIQVSEAALTYSAGTGTSTITECVATGTTVPVTQTASGGVAAVTYAFTSQVPESTPKKFAVDTSTGVLTTLTSATSTLHATTTPSYVIRITAADGTSTPTLDVTVTITGSCSSSASFVFPSLAVMLISLFSLLMKNNN